MKGKRAMDGNGFEDELDGLDEEAFDEMLEDVLQQIGMLVSISGYGHVIDGQLTDLPATEFDTVH